MKDRRSKFEILFESFSDSEKREFLELAKISMLKRGRDYLKIIDELDRGSFRRKSDNKSRSKWNRLSELNKLAEKYLAFRHLELNKEWLEYFALGGMLKRGTYYPLEMRIRNWRKKSLKQKASLDEYKVVKNQMELDLQYLSNIGDGRSYGSVFEEYCKLCFLMNMIELSENLIRDWKLTITKTIEGHTCVRNYLALFDFEKGLEYIRTHLPGSYYPVAFNYYVFQSLCDPFDNCSFRKAIRLFETELSKIRDNRRIDFYLSILNAATNRVNHGVEGAVEEQFRIIRKKVGEELVNDLKSKYILGNHFRDYVLTACKLGKFLWAEKFINKYSECLPSKDSKEIIQLCKAWIRNGKGDHAGCYNLLEDFTTANPFFYVDSVRMKLVSCYESGDFEKCVKLLHSFSQYLRRPHSVQKELLENSIRFSKYFRMLLKCTENPDWAEAKSLLNELEKNIPYSENWLKNKTREIMFRHS